MLIAISETEYRGLIKRAQESTRREFDFYNRPIDFQVRAELIAEGEKLGYEKEFLEQLKKDA